MSTIEPGIVEMQLNKLKKEIEQLRTEVGQLRADVTRLNTTTDVASVHEPSERTVDTD